MPVYISSNAISAYSGNSTMVAPKVGFGVIAAANTARDGSGDLVTCFTAGGSGSIVESVTFTSAQASAAASSAMVGRLFITDTSGANPELLQEVAIATATASNTAIGATQQMFFATGLVVPAGTLLKCAISVYAGVQDKFHVVVRAYDIA